jgi:hypothetical protein
MAANHITKIELQQFKTDLIAEIKTIFKSSEKEPTKKWLKSSEVKQILGISSGTLQNLRVNGTLHFNKIGGVIYYENEQIQKLLNAKKN